MNDAHNGFRPAELGSITVTGGFWAAWQRTNRERTIPYVLEKCDETGRTQAMKLEWKPGDDWDPHPFFDSDVCKSVEAAAYSLHTNPDSVLEQRLDGYIEIIARAQRPDGYLNSYYTLTGLENRWTHLRGMHELYCAGHLFEAAVAHYDATGKRTFLDVASRLADHIDAVIGPAEQDSPLGGKKIPGYPGHPEVELALVKLYRATGEKRYLDLSAFLVNERGSTPHFFQVEAEKRGEPKEKRAWQENDYPAPYAFYQAHIPVREQDTAEGHSVRACYLYAGMVDVARETGDEKLLEACRAIFGSIVGRRMYLTGGIGSSRYGERFTYDYDLPNESAYAETCAAIALIFFASRLLNLDLKGTYGDVVERVLYNGALGGQSLQGDRFYYANPLTYHPTAPLLPHIRVDAERQEWYAVSCCPPNIARLIASLGSYIYSVGEKAVAVHLYAESEIQLNVDGGRGTLVQTTNYPWDGEITFGFDGNKALTFTLALRIPQWAGDYTIEGANGAELRDGYLWFSKTWRPGDHVKLLLPMPPRRVYAHPAVRQDGWCVAIERGPIVYCFEGVDNGDDLAALALPANARLDASFDAELLGGCTVITADGVRRFSDSDPNGSAATPYSSATRRVDSPIRAIPFALRANRGASEMRVWFAEL